MADQQWLLAARSLHEDKTLGRSQKLNLLTEQKCLIPHLSVPFFNFENVGRGALAVSHTTRFVVYVCIIYSFFEILHYKTAFDLCIRLASSCLATEKVISFEIPRYWDTGSDHIWH